MPYKRKRGRKIIITPLFFGVGDGTRTHDVQLGKLKVDIFSRG